MVIELADSVSAFDEAASGVPDGLLGERSLQAVKHVPARQQAIRHKN